METRFAAFFTRVGGARKTSFIIGTVAHPFFYMYVGMR
jgi:hypothetical protein